MLQVLPAIFGASKPGDIHLHTSMCCSMIDRTNFKDIGCFSTSWDGHCYDDHGSQELSDLSGSWNHATFMVPIVEIM